MKRLFICLCLLACMSAQAAAPIAKIQQMLSKQLTGLKRPLASNGRFCVVAGKGILWRTLQPFPSTLRLTRDEIVNFQGERVAMRLDAKQEPTVRMINSVLFAMLAGDLAQLDTLFEVDGEIDGNRWHVALKAREAALSKAIGTIALDGDSYVKNIVINDVGGDRTSIVFSTIQSGDGAMLPEEAALF
jgi:DNA-binding protein